MTYRPILILFANLKGNLGDFAILHAMLFELENQYPGREIHVFSLGQREVDDKRLSGFLEQPHPAFVYKGKTPYREVRRIPSLVKKAGLGPWLAGKRIDRLSHELKKLHPISSAADYEAVFLAGGEQWSGFTSGINLFAILCAISEINPKVFMFPFSIKKKVLETFTQARLNRCFSRISGRILVRDSDSEETMRRIGRDALLGADCVFSLADVVASHRPPPEKDENLVIIAITTTGGARTDGLPAVIENLTQAGFRVRLLTTCEMEDGDDMRMLASMPGVDVSAPATWQEVVAELASSAMVVTNRLHCMILSFFADIPVLPLLNREKVVSVFMDAELTYSLDHIGDLTPVKVRECTGDREVVLRQMRSYLQKTRSLNRTPWGPQPVN